MVCHRRRNRAARYARRALAEVDDPEVGNRLAFIGSVKDEVMDVETMAVRLLAVLGAQYPARLCERYKIDREQASQSEPYELLELIGHKRGMLMRGGEIDTERRALCCWMNTARAGSGGLRWSFHRRIKQERLGESGLFSMCKGNWNGRDQLVPL